MKRIFKNLMLIGFAATLCVACDKEEDDVNGIIAKGTFSVAQGKKVYISQGNLQYQASTNTWRFADNQYDIIGEDNVNVSSTYEGWIDLFGYGTSGWNSGVVAYHPYSVNYQWNDYCINDLTGDYANADWGVYNKISNGGNKAGLWRTLTFSEWHYLLFTRPHSAHLYSKGRVDGIQGLILLPDDWQIPNGIEFLPMENNWTTNDYTVAEWQKMQSNGAIFLPNTGTNLNSSRGDNLLTYLENGGYYWTSSLGYYFYIGEDIVFNHFIVQLDDGSNYVSPYHILNYFSVRLVQDVK